jgi:curved DNA-binding protein CbpA
MPRLDPYETLGVSPAAPDAEVRAAYRRLVQLHHPDHNGGSAASTRRFEEIQEAYAQVRKGRENGTGARRNPTTGTAGTKPPPRPTSGAPSDARLAGMEREIREAHLARERVRQAAREAAAQSYERPSDEELGYIKSDDSLGKILADARAQASERFAEVREPVAKRVADLLDDLAAKLNRDGPSRPRE